MTNILLSFFMLSTMFSNLSQCTPYSPELFQTTLVYLIFSAIGAFVWAPLLIKFLYRFKITRRSEFDFTLKGERKRKEGTPIMGGLLVVVTVSVITLVLNWNRENTYVPIAAMAVSALLGGADDLLNI